MPPISSGEFTVGLASDSDVKSRAARRVICNADVLKAAKIFAGDIVALSDACETATIKVHAIRQFHWALPTDLQFISPAFCGWHCLALA